MNERELRRTFLDTRVPPPLVALVLAAFMWAAARLAPSLTVSVDLHAAAGIVVASAGLLLEVAAGVTLLRARTTVDPIHPGAACSLVTVGIYRFTRNPIYLGDLLLLVGWAVYLANGLALVLTPLFVAYMDRFQIGPEERALAESFGTAYAEYRSRVRRWI